MEESGLSPICALGGSIPPTHPVVQSMWEFGKALPGTAIAQEQLKHKKGTIGEMCMTARDGKDMYTSGMICCLMMCDGEYGMQ